MLLLRTHFSEFVNHKFPFLAFLFFLLPFLLLITYNLKWPLLLSYHPSLPLFLSLLTFPRLLLCQISPPFSPLACPSFCFNSSSLLSSWSSKLGHVFGSKANTASFKQHQSHTHARTQTGLVFTFLFQPDSLRNWPWLAARATCGDLISVWLFCCWWAYCLTATH